VGELWQVPPSLCTQGSKQGFKGAVGWVRWPDGAWNRGNPRFMQTPRSAKLHLANRRLVTHTSHSALWGKLVGGRGRTHLLVCMVPHLADIGEHYKDLLGLRVEEKGKAGHQHGWWPSPGPKGHQ
jgi:hypothetical protein